MASPGTIPLPREERWLRFLPLLLCLIFFIISAALARAHPFGTYSTETDFYHHYEPDAARLAAGQFPTNAFQGPGYPGMLVLVARLAATDYFTAGKWLSVFSGALAGLLVFGLFRHLFGFWVGLGAQAILYASPEYPTFSVHATTDLFFLALSLAALLLFLRGAGGARTRVALAGALAGLAYLTRYNALFLVLAGLFGLTILDLCRVNWRARALLSALFLGAFLLVSAPWLYANYRQHGSPFYNTNYLNIATEYYPELAEGNTVQEGTRKLALMFNSFGDVLRYDPARIARHYPRNIYENLRLSVMSALVGPWVGWCALAGFALALFARPSRAVLFILGSTVFYFLILSLTHWETRYYFFIMAIYAGLAVYAPARLLALARVRGLLRHPAFTLLPVALFLGMFLTSLVEARHETRKFIASHPYEILKACRYFREAGLAGARVVARKPHIAALCGQQWVFFPQVKSLDGLREWLREHPVDFLTISSVEISRRKDFTPLKDPRNAPPWLSPAWVHDGDAPFVLYRVETSRLDQP